MKQKVLVFPCGSELGLEIHRSLQYEKGIQLYGGSSVPNDPGKLVYENYYNEFPLINHPRFINYLNDFIKEHQIDIIYPAMDSVILTISRYLDEINCKVLLTDKDTIEICMSKSKSYRYFKNILEVPKIFTKPSEKDLPLFTKPDIGYGSRNAQMVRSADELEYLRKKEELIFIEYLPGKEYTVDCFTNNKGELMFVGARERKRIVNGISANAVPIENKKFFEIAHLINDNLKFNGAWFFQVKENREGELSLLEIAPRIAGVSGLYRNMGVNLPLLSIYNLLDNNVEIIKNDLYIELEKSFVSKFKVHYNYKNLYIDLDDTIVVNGKINLSAIKIIYQSINDSCKVILITRHKGNLYEYLKKFKIDSLFDEIIWVTDQKLKSEFIQRRESIFIDDSFRERKEVKDNLNIPVFSVDAIECLLK